MRLNISQDDIDKGEPMDKCNCPIARAIYALTGRVAWVDGESAFVGDQCATLPPRARRFVMLFDNGKPVKPVKIVLSFVQMPSEYSD